MLTHLNIHDNFRQKINFGGGDYMGGSLIQDKRDKKWHISVYWQGKRYRIFINPQTKEPFYDKKQAEKQLSIIRGEFDRGEFNPKSWFPESPLSVSVYAKEWLTLLTVSPKTKAGYATAVNKYISVFFRDMDIRHIRHNDLLKFKLWLDKIREPKGVYNIFGALKKMMRDAWKNEDIVRVPPFPVVPIGDESDEVEYLTFDQQQKILEAIPECHRALFECGMEFGLRTQEVRALQKDCIVDGHIVIRRKFSENKLAETTKTGKKGIRRIGITQYMMDVFSSLPVNLSPFIFVRKDGKPYTNKDLNKIWHDAEVKAGIKCKLQNAFRHSLGCQMLDQDESIDLVQGILGHTNLKMTQRYAKRKIAKSTEALERRRGNVVNFRQGKDRK
ncbi:MAG: hypothetical protein C4518_01400 [Desulfobacteraceae bacterium]|nr:MAG: hypothetical protein C4518_01400 [Desulfobacteraceae bacterium]